MAIQRANMATTGKGTPSQTVLSAQLLQTMLKQERLTEQNKRIFEQQLDESRRQGQAAREGRAPLVPPPVPLRVQAPSAPSPMVSQALLQPKAFEPIVRPIAPAVRLQQKQEEQAQPQAQPPTIAPVFREPPKPFEPMVRPIRQQEPQAQPTPAPRPVPTFAQTMDPYDQSVALGRQRGAWKRREDMLSGDRAARHEGVSEKQSATYGVAPETKAAKMTPFTPLEPEKKKPEVISFQEQMESLEPVKPRPSLKPMYKFQSEPAPTTPEVQPPVKAPEARTPDIIPFKREMEERIPLYTPPASTQLPPPVVPFADERKDPFAAFKVSPPTQTPAPPSQAVQERTQPTREADDCRCFADAIQPLLDAVRSIRLPESVPLSAAPSTKPIITPEKEKPLLAPKTPDTTTAQSALEVFGGLKTASAAVAEAFLSLGKISIDTSAEMSGVKDATGKAIQSFRDMGQSVAERVSAAAKSAYQGVGKAVEPIRKTAGQTFDWVKQGIGSAARKAKDLIPEKQRKALGKGFGMAKKALGKAGGKIGEGLSRAGKAAMPLAKTATQGVAKAAKATYGAVKATTQGSTDFAMGMISQFQAVSYKMAGFVESLSPASTAVFGQAMRDLSATIGVALLPAFNTATGIVRDFTAGLLPVMRGLSPIIGDVGKTFSGLASTFSNTFASVLTTITPGVKLVAGVFDALSAPIQGLMAGFNGIVEMTSSMVQWFGKLIGFDTKGFTSGLKGAFETLTRTTLVTAASLLRMFSPSLSEDFVKGVTKSLTGEGVASENAAGTAVVQNVNLGGIQEYMRKVMTSSATAGMVGEDKYDPKAWAQKTVGELQKVTMGQDAVTKAINGMGDRIVQAIITAAKRAPQEAWTAATQAAERYNPLQSAGNAIGDVASYLLYGQ